MTERPLGLQGEDQAAAYLKKQGLRILDRHYQTRWGEIDLICRDRETWVFVEVKTRTRASQPSAADVITVSKQKKLVGVAISYMKKHQLKDQAMRFDVVTIEADSIDWITDAFEPSAKYTY